MTKAVGVCCKDGENCVINEYVGLLAEGNWGRLECRLKDETRSSALVKLR